MLASGLLQKHFTRGKRGSPRSPCVNPWRERLRAERAAEPAEAAGRTGWAPLPGLPGRPRVTPSAAEPPSASGLDVLAA